MNINQLVHDVPREAAFSQFAEAFTQRGVRTWSTPEERALLYGLANRCTPGGVIVELGSYCGGSAAFFAKGLADKPGADKGKVVCIDPLLGAPPWLALPPHMFTLTELKANLAALGVDQYVKVVLGDSASVGTTWPSELIDVLLIDGDHSFEGALRDLECWAPKLRDHGILLFDDIDNIAEMRALDEIMGQMRTLARRGAIGGIAIYEVQGGGGWHLLEELHTLLMARQIYRPWSFDKIHSVFPSPPYHQTHEWSDPAFDIAYDLAYLGVAREGNYAILEGSHAELVKVARSVHTDRGGGDLYVTENALKFGRTFRLVVCRLEQVDRMSRALLPGGLLLASSDAPMTADMANGAADILRSSGLDGVGYGQGERPLFWGVADIAALAPGNVLQALLAVRVPRT